jgi:hypothetical protein
MQRETCVMLVFFHSDSNGQTNSSIKALSSSASRYVFMSIAALSTVPVLQGYLAALMKHVAQREKRIAQLKKQGGREDTWTRFQLHGTREDYPWQLATCELRGQSWRGYGCYVPDIGGEAAKLNRRAGVARCGQRDQIRAQLTSVGHYQRRSNKEAPLSYGSC